MTPGIYQLVGLELFACTVYLDWNGDFNLHGYNQNIGQFDPADYQFIFVKED
jgi:hypothetical protein